LIHDDPHDYRGRRRRAPDDARVIALVGAAHFVSHIYIMVLPPLFPFVRADFASPIPSLASPSHCSISSPGSCKHPPVFSSID
jgi:hypothetical protein